MVNAAFLSVSEVARVLGVSERHVRELLRRRDPATGQPVIPSGRLGRRVLVPRSWLEEFVAASGARLEAER